MLSGTIRMFHGVSHLADHISDPKQTILLHIFLKTAFHKFLFSSFFNTLTHMVLRVMA